MHCAHCPDCQSLLAVSTWCIVQPLMAVLTLEVILTGLGFHRKLWQAMFKLIMEQACCARLVNQLCTLFGWPRSKFLNVTSVFTRVANSLKLTLLHKYRVFR